MSLGVVVKGPEGVVLAADSRVTLQAQKKDGDTPMVVNFDNATKLLSLSNPHNYVGAVTYGAAVIGLRTAHSFIPEFESTLPVERLPILDYANRLSGFFVEQWNKGGAAQQAGQSMNFIVGGYDPGAAYGSVYVVSVPNSPTPSPRNPGDASFGITWGGQLDIGQRLIHGHDPALLGIVKQVLGADDRKMEELSRVLREKLQLTVPYQVLPLQDCIDLATFVIRTTMSAQDLSVGIRGVGGPIDVAFVTKTNGLEYVQRKGLRGERGTNP